MDQIDHIQTCWDVLKISLYNVQSVRIKWVYNKGDYVEK